MSKIKSSCLFRTISLILILTFISFDISYAYPPEHDAGNSTLATPSVLQQVLVSEHAARFQQSVFSQGALIASVYDIGEYFFGNADKGIGSLPSKYAEGAINMDFGKHLSGANTEILNIVPVEYIKQTSPEKLKSVLEEIGFKGTLPDEGVVFILYKKDDKKFLVQIAKKGEVRPENLPGYEWVVSDKYVVKYMPEDYAGEDHRLSITEPIAEIEAPANRTEETVVPASQAIVSQVNAHTSIKTQNIALENVATSVSAKEMLISYENIWEDFRRLTDYPDPKKLADIYKGYEAVLNNTRRPGRTDILSTTFELPKGEVSDAFERLTDEVIKVLPKGAVYHKIDPSTYHISVTPIQNLPFDVLGKKLTDNERRAVEEAVAKISSEQLPYRVKFLGLCFGTDGGVIAVFEDESLKTKSLRGKLITECNKVCDNKVSVKPKPLIHITLLRIFSKVAGRDLEKFKARAEELKDLSGLGLSMDLNKLGFNHEVRWMHTELDYSKSYPLGHKTELASTGQGIEGQKENSDLTQLEASRTSKATQLFEIVESARNEEKAKFVDADSAVGSLVVLARKAKRENQKLIIGLETDWIPGINVKGSLQKNAIAALMKEIDSIGETLRSMGLDNVEVIRDSGSQLADSLTKAAKDSHTNMRNIVVMASKETITSANFRAFRDASEEDKPFLTGIDPAELIKLYAEFGEATSKQLHIRLASLLYMTLELAAGKEPPQSPIIISYDKKMRILILLPKADPIDYETLKNNYAAEKTALASA